MSIYKSVLDLEELIHRKLRKIYYEMSQIQKLTSEKGKSMLLHASYLYTLERSTADKLIFRCRNRNCKGRLILFINVSH